MLNRPDLLIPFLLFSFVAFYTPGPNNLMLMTSGLNFGFRNTLPAMLGVACGFSFLTLCVGLGLGAVFISYPILYSIIKYVGAAYMLYLAWRIATSEPPSVDITSEKKSISFVQACALQWVNPKGWAMAVGVVSCYSALASYPTNIFLIAGMFVVIGLGSSSAWAGLEHESIRFAHNLSCGSSLSILQERKG